MKHTKNISRAALRLAMMPARSAARILTALPLMILVTFMPLTLLCFIAQANAAEPAPLRAALVVEKDYGDTALTDALRQGLERARLDGDLSVTVVETPNAALSLDAADVQADAFRQMAQSHDIVIVATPALHEVLMNNAGNYRKTRFVSIGAEVKAPNIASVTFASNEASFLAGAAAALLASSQGKPGETVLGWLGDYDTPAQKAEQDAFLEGARLVEPGVRVLSAYSRNQDDVEMGRKVALDLLGRGAQLVAHNAGNAGLGVVKAAQQQGRYAVSQISTEPKTAGQEANVPFSQFRRVDQALYQVLRATVAGSFPGNTLTEHNLANGMVGLTDLGTLPPAAAERVRQLSFEIQRGGIKVPKAVKKNLCDCL